MEEYKKSAPGDSECKIKFQLYQLFIVMKTDSLLFL